MQGNEEYHIPVLLKEALEGLQIKKSGIYVDVTFGGGGHSRAILEMLGPDGRLYAFDQDEQAAGNVPQDPRLVLINQNFRYLKNYLRHYRVDKIDGLLADLGVSSHQFDSPERGFSLRFEGPLDMRMNKQSSLTAAMVVNEYEEPELKRILKMYGELSNASQITTSIARQRSEKKIQTIEDLKEALQRFAPRNKWHQFFAKVFQALRIEVNQELQALEQLLQQSSDVIRPGGRLVVISYHSLEDRLVKNYIRSGNTDGILNKDFFGNLLRPFEPIGKQPVVPTEEEINRNNRARSAKMRIAERKDEQVQGK